MNAKVFNRDEVIAHRKARMGSITRATYFEGRKEGIFGKQVKAHSIFTRHKEGDDSPEARLIALDEMRAKLQANAPDAGTIEDFFGKFFIEVTRRAIESPDLTSLIAREVVDASMPESPTLRSLLPFRGQMLQVDGSNDAVPLIEQQTGALATVLIKIWGIGWKDTLKNLLFNEFWTMEKVVQAAVDAYTDRRNALTVGVIVGTTYDNSQQQAAETPATGESVDSTTYRTFRAAIKKLQALLDPQTNRKIGKRQISILCNSTDTWQIERVIRGQLEANGGGAVGAIRAALPIQNIVEYDQGINDGFTVGKTLMDFPGVPEGKCYLFVPDVAIVAVKAGLTMETGTGTPLQLSTEERAWYMAQGEFFDDFLGTSSPNTDLADGFGFIVEVTLPTGNA